MRAEEGMEGKRVGQGRGKREVKVAGVRVGMTVVLA